MAQNILNESDIYGMPSAFDLNLALRFGALEHKEAV